MGFVKRRIGRLVRRKVRNPARAAGRRAVASWCPECQKRQPPFHVCMIKTDFKRRTKDARRPRSQGHQAHDYRTCRDHDCKRPACAAFREGQAACSRPHQ